MTLTALVNDQQPGLPPVAGPDWREHLPRLDGLGLILLPIGANPPDRKAPVNPATGKGLQRWQQHPGFTPAELAPLRRDRVIGACINTGPSGLDVLDIDGPAAVGYLEARGLDPRDPALFRITRTTDPDRFKIPFRLTPEQRQRFPETKTLLRVGEPDAEGRRQALEIYAKTGAQVICLGYHTKSDGWYDWAGDPSQIGEPSEAWLEAMLAICAEVEALRGQGDPSTPRKVRGLSGGNVGWRGSGSNHPCPVCGRDHSSACSYADATNGRRIVTCFHGGTFSAPEGLKKGDTFVGRDGTTWAFVERYYADCLGEKSLFIDHRPSGNGTGITETAVSGGGDTDGVIRAWHITATEEDAAAINAAGFHAMTEAAARASKIDWKGLTVFLAWDSLTLAQGPAPHGEVRTLAFDLEKAGGRVRVVLIPCEVPTAGGNCTPEVWRNTPASFIERHGADAFRVLTEFARHCVEKEKDPDTKKWNYSWVWGREVKQTREKALIAWTVFKDGFQIDAETGALHRWVGTHWNGEDGAGEKSLQCWLAWWLDSMAWRNTSTVGEVSHELVRRLLVKMPADLVAEKGILPCRNGCLRLADRVLLPHAPEMGNTWVLSYGYDPSASAQPILDFLHECLENREDVQVLRAGLWAAVRRLGVKALLELVGKGDSGKSVVASLAIALVGDADTGVSTLERIEDPRQRFETVKMRGKALAIFNEVQNYVGPLEVLKAMTGRDRISAELKNSTANVDFVFHGLIMLVGNGPLRSTDRSSAVINRRRTISAPHAVPVEKQRPMLEKSAAGDWVGELSGSLSGFLNWVLDTDPAEAKRMLSNATGSLARIEAELDVLLEDPLAEWAEDFLVFDQSQGPDGKPVHSLGIGTITGSPINGGSLGGERERFAFPAYRQWMEEEKHGCVPISGKVFKECLVKLLRDSLRLPLPQGSLKSPPYKHRLHGSRIPFVRWRTAADGEGAGIIRQAKYREVKSGLTDSQSETGGVTDATGGGGPEMGPEMGKTQSGDGCDGSTLSDWLRGNENGFKGGEGEGADTRTPFSPRGVSSGPPNPSHPFLDCDLPISDPSRGAAIRHTPTTHPQSHETAVSAPLQTTRELVEMVLAELKLAPTPAATQPVLDCLTQQGHAPTRAAVSLSLDAIARDQQDEGLDPWL